MSKRVDLVKLPGKRAATKRIYLIDAPFALSGYGMGVCVVGLDAANASLWVPATWAWVLSLFSQYTLVVFCAESVFSLNAIFEATPTILGFGEQAFINLKKMLQQQTNYDDLIRGSGVQELGCEGIHCFSISPIFYSCELNRARMDVI